MPRLKEESLGGTSWCLQDLLQLWSILHLLELIRERSNQRYVALFSKYMFFMVSILFLKYLVFFVTIDLESLGWIFYTLTIKGMATK